MTPGARTLIKDNSMKDADPILPEDDVDIASWILLLVVVVWCSLFCLILKLDGWWRVAVTLLVAVTGKFSVPAGLLLGVRCVRLILAAIVGGYCNTKTAIGDFKRGKGIRMAEEEAARRAEAERLERARKRREAEERRREEERQRREQESQQRAKQPPRTVKDTRHHAGVLGVDENSPFDSIQKKYRVLAMQYHPDKIDQSGPKLRELAKQEMQEINEAYEFFKKRYGRT